MHAFNPAVSKVAEICCSVFVKCEFSRKIFESMDVIVSFHQAGYCGSATVSRRSARYWSGRRSPPCCVNLARGLRIFVTQCHLLSIVMSGHFNARNTSEPRSEGCFAAAFSDVSTVSIVRTLSGYRRKVRFPAWHHMNVSMASRGRTGAVLPYRSLRERA